MYSHVNTNGGVVDCEWYSVLDILLDLCEAVGGKRNTNDAFFPPLRDRLSKRQLEHTQRDDPITQEPKTCVALVKGSSGCNGGVTMIIL